MNSEKGITHSEKDITVILRVHRKYHYFLEKGKISAPYWISGLSFKNTTEKPKSEILVLTKFRPDTNAQPGISFLHKNEIPFDVHRMVKNRTIFSEYWRINQSGILECKTVKADDENIPVLFLMSHINCPDSLIRVIKEAYEKIQPPMPLEYLEMSDEHKAEIISQGFIK